MLSNNNAISLTAKLCRSDPIKELTTGVLYKLYAYHPAVDYVGVLEEDGTKEKYFLFLQLSVTLTTEVRCGIYM